jgi:selenocysteine-specific elongation factor
MSSVVVGTAGHIDHGKSALVRALTGTDPDRLKEEKDRGITIDLGFAHLEVDDMTFAFVDVPGHERFVKNMLAGAGGIDLVLLIVAANEGVMPQTREHFDICRLLGVRRGIVVLTKADLVSPEELELARADARELVAGSFLDRPAIHAVSATTGEGLDALRAALVDTARQVEPRSPAGRARLPIDRVFTMKGFGTVVTGTLVSGTIKAGDQLAVLPGDRRVSIRGVQVHGRSRPDAAAGQRGALNIAGAAVDELSRGLSLATPGSLTTTTIVDASVDVLPGAAPIKQGARVRFHQGTAELIGRVSVIGVSQGKAPVSIGSGTRGFVRVRLEQPAALTRGDQFILRTYSPSVTIAGGTVLDPAPPRTAIRTAAAVERLRRLGASDLDAVAALLDDAGTSGVPVDALMSRAGIQPDAVAPLADRLNAEGRASRVSDLLIATPVLERAKAQLIEALQTHHRHEPLSDGLPREEARVRVFRRAATALFERVVEELTAAGIVSGRDRLRLTAHKPDARPEDAAMREAIERTLRSAELTPPLAAALAAEAGVPAAAADRLVRTLQREKRVIKVDDFWFHADVLAELKQKVAAMKGKDGVGKLDVATFKARFGVTRKFAIPLLEYLDRERVTRRAGEARMIL